ncbi:MAG TPA: hypothetical protein VKV38_17135 [Trebonia sp.]|nr:hypothetical protein [Trebonia sp.]
MPTGPPAAIVPHARAVRLPGTSVTYYDDPAAPAQLSSYIAPNGYGYIRQPDGAFAPVHPLGQGTVSPDGRWTAAIVLVQEGFATGTRLTVTDRRTGRSRTIATPGFTVAADSILTWSASGARLFVTAVSADRNIGFAWGDAPGFGMHLVSVPGDGWVYDDSFFYADPAGTGAVFNVQVGSTRVSRVAGPLRFVTLTGAQTSQVPGAVIPSPLPTPFSPSGKLLLVLCSVGQCVLNAATGGTVAKIPFLGYDGGPEYPAQDIGWYDNSHFLSWIAVGADQYELVTADLSGLVTGVLAIDRSLDIPQMYFRPRGSAP